MRRLVGLIGQIVAEASIDAPRSYSTEVYEEYIERRKCLIDGLNKSPKSCRDYGLSSLSFMEQGSESVCEWQKDSGETEAMFIYCHYSSIERR